MSNYKILEAHSPQELVALCNALMQESPPWRPLGGPFTTGWVPGHPHEAYINYCQAMVCGEDSRL